VNADGQSGPAVSVRDITTLAVDDHRAFRGVLRDLIAAAQCVVSRHPEVRVVLISANDPTLHPEVVALDSSVACARKQDLRPRRLTELWETVADSYARRMTSIT
jgi:hypothetical protein